jgi:DNA-binding CsgD family transcriptional regulator
MTLHTTDPIGFYQADRRFRLFWELRLTKRQIECLYWAQEGKSAFDIGLILGISPRTVEGHLAKVCRTLGVRTRIQAIVKARELGLLEELRL